MNDVQREKVRELVSEISTHCDPGMVYQVDDFMFDIVMFRCTNIYGEQFLRGQTEVQDIYVSIQVDGLIRVHSGNLI